MLLARGGVDVTVLERRDRVGGRTSAIEAQGFRFDMGPTFFLYPQILREIFQVCGYNLDQEVELLRLDPHYRLIFQDAEAIEATADVQRMKAQIARLSPADAEHLDRYLGENRRKFAAFTPILQSPWESWRSVLSPALARKLPLVRPWSSVDQDLKRYFKDPRVRLAFSFQSKYLGMSPFKCPSLFTILSYLEYDFGVFHPRGGCAAVSEAMARTVMQMGVRIQLNAEVKELLFHGRRVVGAKTAAGSFRADATVVNADFANAMQHLVPDRLRRRWRDRKLNRKKYSCSTFMMYLGIDGHVDHLQHHNIFLARDYAKNLLEIERDHRLSANPSVYVQNPCVSDPSLAPPGQSTLYILAPVTHLHPHVDWAQQTQTFRNTVFAQLTKMGVTDLPRRIRYEKIITPADWQTDMRIYRGATFNLAHTFRQMLHLRPRNRFEDIPGMYLVGGGTHPGSGLPVIYEGARITASLLLDDLAMPSSWIRQPPQPAITRPTNCSPGPSLTEVA